MEMENNSRDEIRGRDRIITRLYKGGNWLSHYGQHLSEDLLQGHTTSYTDGTVKTCIGAHAYTIHTNKDVDETCLYGTAGTPGNSTTMTSLRAEHYGVYASIILLDIITLVHGHRSVSQHTHYTDSQSVIDRLQKFSYMTDRQYDTTDYDIWTETKKLFNKHNILNSRSNMLKGISEKVCIMIKESRAR
jgi:hypothetical protein